MMESQPTLPLHRNMNPDSHISHNCQFKDFNRKIMINHQIIMMINHQIKFHQISSALKLHEFSIVPFINFIKLHQTIFICNNHWVSHLSVSTCSEAGKFLSTVSKHLMALVMRASFRIPTYFNIVSAADTGNIGHEPIVYFQLCSIFFPSCLRSLSLFFVNHDFTSTIRKDSRDLLESSWSCFVFFP